MRGTTDGKTLTTLAYRTGGTSEEGRKALTIKGYPWAIPFSGCLKTETSVCRGRSFSYKNEHSYNLVGGGRR
jgi:hypothetical protein